MPRNDTEAQPSDPAGRSALRTLIQKIQDTLRPYIDHARGCSINVNASNPDGDYCDCNVKLAIERANKLADELAAAARAARPTIDLAFVHGWIARDLESAATDSKDVLVESVRGLHRVVGEAIHDALAGEARAARPAPQAICKCPAGMCQCEHHRAARPVDGTWIETEMETALKQFDGLRCQGVELPKGSVLAPHGGVATVLDRSDVMHVLLHLRARLRRGEAPRPVSAPAKETELQIAERIARNAHAGQKEESTGDDYIRHVERVVGLVDGDQAKAVAWLHDVLEDTDVVAYTLASSGVSKPVFDAVRVLTRNDADTYAEYISTLRDAKDPLAIAVKLADLRDHLRPNCPARLRPRYERALKDLEALVEPRPVSAPAPDLRCTECQHVFPAAAVAQEDREVWGHPCHANGQKIRKGVTPCESSRVMEPLETVSEPANHAKLIARLLSDANDLEAADTSDPYGLQFVGEDVVRLITLLRAAATALSPQPRPVSETPKEGT